MKYLTLAIFLIAKITSAQKISLSDMFNLYEKRADSISLISKITSMRFNKISYEEEKTFFKGTQGILVVFKTKGEIDALEYRTLDSNTYKSWHEDLLSAGCTYWMKDGKYDIYTSEFLEILTARYEDYYGLVLLNRPKK